MTSTYGAGGRLCNHIFRNLCVSMIANKHDLHVVYEDCYHANMSQLGIVLFCGKTHHSYTKEVTDSDFFDVLNAETIDYNLDSLHSYFQTKDISLLLYNYLHQNSVRQGIIEANPFKDRLDSNNDCFIHIRLTDVENLSPGLPYYKKALSTLSFDILHIASDDLNHPVIHQIMDIYPNSRKVELNEVQTIQFGCTNKFLVLSPGTFSAIIGYLSAADKVLYPGVYQQWHGDIFSIPGWTRVTEY